MKVWRKMVLAVVASVTVAMMFGSIAGATVSIPQNPVPVSAGQTSTSVNVTWSGTPANSPLFLNQCKKNPSDPTFNFSFDCTLGTNINPAANPTGSGSATFPLFRGDEPSGDKEWGCYAPGDTPAAGYEVFNTCYIRISPGDIQNNAQSQGLAFTFVVQGAPIPEAPTVILLPLVAGSVLGAAFLFSRRRSAHARVA
jgi:hypothetical protein